MGTNLVNFLANNKACILKNPWHVISLKPLPDGSWSVYDPNFVNGARVVAKEDLIQTIHNAIGSLVSVDLCHTCIPGIPNPNDFIEQGGLLALSQCANVKEMMATIPKNYRFSAAALDGILLRNLGGKPAWILALNNPLTTAFTQELLQQFEQANPDTFQQQLHKSLGAMNALEKHKAITTLVQNQRTINQPVTKEQSIPNRLSNNLIHIIRTAPQLNFYEQRLKTWLKPHAKANTLLEYTQHCLSSDAPKKRLIELNDSSDVNALHFALENHAKNTHRPFYYIHSPDDLVCSTPFIERNGAIGIMKQGPGGPLHDFLTATRKPNAPVLVVNYENFDAEDIVRLNALIDKERLADGTPLPEQAQVIGLLNKNKPECYTGSDFYSRFNQVETCPLSSKQLAPAIPQIPIVSADALSEKPYAINLFHSSQWKEMLLGHWVLDGKKITFREGELAKVKGHAITIQNGPWDDKEFQRFWQTACLLGKVDYAGSTFTIPEHLQLVQSEGYDWSLLKNTVHFTDNINSLDDPIAINPSRFNECFSRYEYQDSDKSIIKLPGLIESAQGKTLNLHITRTLSDDNWARLLTECQHHNVTLNAFCAPEIELPDALKQAQPATTRHQATWDGVAPLTDRYITSTDVDTTVAMLTKNQNDLQIIDVTECGPTDLLLKLDAILDKDSLEFVFKQKEGAVLQGLAANKHILLKGRFSEELADHLAPLLLQRQRTDKNTAQILIVSDQQDSFQYLPNDVHEVSIEEKKTCLGVISDELAKKLAPFLDSDSLSQLIARRDFWQAFPDKPSSDEAWIGMHHLPDRLQSLTPLDPDNSAQQAKDFIKARQDVVNDALDRAPYVLLTGLTGVGKSTFVSKHLARTEDSLYQGDNKIKAWATDTTTVGRKILFIDEATLSSRDWSEFEGLFQNPRGMLVDGTFYPLSPEHKVVFAGNPISYGDERQLASLFKRHGNAILFEPLPTEVLHHNIIKPIFAHRALEQHTFKLSAHFLDVYRFLVDCSTTEVLITPRELQMMALLTQSYCLKNPDANAEEVARHYAYSLVQHLVPKNRQAEFDTQYKPEPPLKRQVSQSECYTLTPSRLPMRALLDDLLDLRELRQQSGNEEQQYGGLGGLILEGEPGVGKSELVIDTLRAHQFVEMHDFNLPATAEKAFYRMPVSMSLPEKERLLRKAFDEGAIVLIDEINSSPMIERLLNELLMGKTPEGTRPKNPGFMVIGTQNPITMAGRRAPSTALARRMITKELPSYPAEEMQRILIEKGMSKTEAKSMITAFNKNLDYAKINRLEPIPCFRDLIELADELLRAQKSNPEESKELVVDIDAGSTNFLENNLLTQLKFDTHLAQIKKKTDQFTDSIIPGYKKAHEAAETLYNKLVSAKQTFLDSTDPMSDKVPVFKQSCLDAISNSRQILNQHRGWKIILSDLVKALVFILTLGASDSKQGKKLFGFFPDIRTDSAKKLDNLQVDIEQEQIQSNKNS
jgi:MoxR-like ATPase